jgi:hypothetical protein
MRAIFGIRIVDLKAEEVAPSYGATSSVTSHFALSYWTSFKTACCAWLDCCRAAMPVDCSTLY